MVPIVPRPPRYRRATLFLATLGSLIQRRKRALLASGAALALLASGFAAYRQWQRTAPTVVTIDASARYQTIDGWSVYPRYWEDDKTNNRFDRSFEPYTGQVSDYLVNELGLNAVRIEIWSGLENPKDHWHEHYEGRLTYTDYANLRYEKINDNDDPNVLDPNGFQVSKFDHRMSMVMPLVRAIEERGEKPFLTVCYVDFTASADSRRGTLDHAEHPEEFAEFVLFFFQRLKEKYGLSPDSFEIILEPENTFSWRGPQIGRALVGVARRLEDEGFTPRFIAPSNTSMSNAIDYFDEMAKVPGALELLDTFSYHRYRLERTAYAEEIWQRAREHGKKTAMLEKMGAGIDVLFEDLVVGHVSGWQQWAAAERLEFDYGHYALVDNRDATHTRILPAKASLLLSQVFRYVRRGAVRIGAASDRRDKRVVAFVNASGDQVVVVRARRAGGALTLRGLAPGRYGLRFVGNDDRVSELAPVDLRNGELVTTLPGPGALAVYARQGP
jgi:hypothetical protein